MRVAATLKRSLTPWRGAREAAGLGAAAGEGRLRVPEPGPEAGELSGAGGERGYWRTAWYEFRHDRLAMVGLTFVVILVLAAVLASVIAPYGPNQQLASGLTAAGNPRTPGAQFVLGTDPLGRDELTRLLFGSRISLVVGLGSAMIGALLGLGIGGVAGLFGGLVE